MDHRPLTSRDDTAQIFLEKSRALLTSDYLVKIERSLDHIDDDDIWWRPNDASNSIGNLMLHLCGNVTMWIIGGVGRRPFERNRQMEFDERRAIPAAELLARLQSVVGGAEEVIRGLTPDELVTRRQIQGYDVTVLEAIYHVVEHFGMHTGQIILLSKARAAKDLTLWRPVEP